MRNSNVFRLNVECFEVVVSALIIIIVVVIVVIDVIIIISSVVISSIKQLKLGKAWIWLKNMKRQLLTELDAGSGQELADSSSFEKPSRLEEGS